MPVDAGLMPGCICLGTSHMASQCMEIAKEDAQ